MTRTDQDFKSRLINLLKVVQTAKGLPAMQESRGLSLAQEDPLERGWFPSPVLPGESCGQRSPAGYSPRGPKELHVTDGLTLSLSKRIKANITNMPPEWENIKKNQTEISHIEKYNSWNKENNFNKISNVRHKKWRTKIEHTDLKTGGTDIAGKCIRELKENISQKKKRKAKKRKS